MFGRVFAIILGGLLLGAAAHDVMSHSALVPVHDPQTSGLAIAAGVILLALAFLPGRST